MKPQSYPVHLNDAQRQELTDLIGRGRALARSQAKARILLLCDQSQGHNRSDQTVAEAVLCHPATVLRTRRCFADEGLEAALYDKARPGPDPKLTGEAEAHLVVLACSAPPNGRATWTLQLLADKLVELQVVPSISATQVGVRLKKIRSNPGR